MFKSDTKADPVLQTPLFAGLSKPQRAMVARAVTQLDLPAGHVVMREGSSGHDMFVVVEGALTMTRGGRSVGTVGPGDFFGEPAVRTGGRRTTTVTTDESVRLLHVDGRALPALIEHSDQVASRMLSPVARRADLSTAA